MDDRPDIALLELGTVDYGRALALQRRLRAELDEADGGPRPAGYLLVLEHPPVVTLGKRGDRGALARRDRLASRGVDLYEIERGGEATYHGPGQLVLYPILKIEELGLGVVDLIRGLSARVADAMAEHGVEVGYDADHPGLWTESPRRKLASVGMRVRSGITTHGAAINLTNELAPFDDIVACGMPDAQMARLTDLADAAEAEIAPGAFARRLYPELEELIGADLRREEVAVPPASEAPSPLDY